MEKHDIKNLSFTELKADLSALGFTPYMAGQIFSWLYKKGVNSFEVMSNISRKNISKLEEKFYVGGLSLVKRLKSKDGTEKFLFELADRQVIEAVFIPAKGRNTLCLSSQVGCKFKCSFCASGKNFVRNLTVSEITSQLSEITKITGKIVTNVVFMGIGEPLDNYDNLLGAIRILNSSEGFNIGARRITISTCGMIPRIERLSDEALQVELSVSLHAVDNELRSRLMPVNKKYPLDKLMPCLAHYIEKTGRQVTFEYVLIKGINDSLNDADKLSELSSTLNSKVNLIVFNAQDNFSYQPPDKETVLAFKGRLIKNGTFVTLRQARGDDISAACGQLRTGYSN